MSTVDPPLSNRITNNIVHTVHVSATVRNLTLIFDAVRLFIHGPRETAQLLKPASHRLLPHAKGRQLYAASCVLPLLRHRHRPAVLGNLG